MHAGPADSMDLSQSQQAAGAVPEEAGLPRKLARARLPSPPCARNIFTDGPEEEPDQATRLTRRPPYVSRYRYPKPSKSVATSSENQVSPSAPSVFLSDPLSGMMRFGLHRPSWHV